MVCCRTIRKYSLKKPIFIGVLKGSFIFTADLLRSIKIDCEVEFIKVQSYKGTQSTGNVKIISDIKTNLKGRHIIVVEDIIDSGKTIKFLISEFKKKSVKSISIATFLMKSNQQKFDFPIGYSDNGESELVDIAAVSLGACIIEKHYTLNKKFDGPDHAFSIEPNKLKQLISQLSLIKKMTGTGLKQPTSLEISNKPAIRKSITAKIDIEKGEKLNEHNISVKRPEGGIEPKSWNDVISKSANKLIKKDSVIKWDDLV